MAPRKRATKQRKNNLKVAKLEALLQDFDNEVKTIVGQLIEKRNHLLKSVDNSYNMAIIKLPKAVRGMNWLDHCRSEKPKSPEVDDAKREEEAARVESVLAEEHAVLPKTVKKTSKKKAEAKSSPEDENTPGHNTVKKARATRKPPTTSKRAKALSVSKQNTSVARSNRKPLVTPARNMMDSSLMMGPTPLVTPRFDPRLPKTPAVRIPRHKERVYSISVNGSPIAAGSEEVVINVPIGNGESIQLLASQMDSVDLSLLDETALKSIRLLQNRLTTLCGPSE
ncbi:borealin [Myripristis murdjan]|uniref:Cell division cycle associated 8 n=1 Tax=Myripristis murdjan TaxID=586833 RepID=A0A668A4M6_9TELE|nr:borealin [Myripristis murdjan]